MSLFRHAQAPHGAADPWNDEAFVVNNNTTDLRTMREMAQQTVDRSSVPSPEGGMARSIVALCEEIDRLHVRLGEGGSS